MKWFKHYSTALNSNSLSIFFANEGFKGYGRYWRLLELMAVKFDGENDTEFAFSIRDLKDQLSFHRNQDLIKFISSLNQVGIMSHRTVNQAIIILTPILLELQSRDFKKARRDRAETAPKNKDKRIKNKEINKENISFSSVSNFENQFKFDYQGLFDAYPKKTKRTESLCKLKQIVTSLEKQERVLQAISRYRQHAANEGTETKYLIAMPKFLDEWKDWENFDLAANSEFVSTWVPPEERGKK